MERNLVNERELAIELGLKPKTLQLDRWKKKGLPYYKNGNGEVRYDLDECKKLYFAKNRNFTRVEPQEAS